MIIKEKGAVEVVVDGWNTRQNWENKLSQVTREKSYQVDSMKSLWFELKRDEDSSQEVIRVFFGDIKIQASLKKTWGYDN